MQTQHVNGILYPLKTLSRTGKYIQLVFASSHWLVCISTGTGNIEVWTHCEASLIGRHKGSLPHLIPPNLKSPVYPVIHFLRSTTVCVSIGKLGRVMGVDGLRPTRDTRDSDGSHAHKSMRSSQEACNQRRIIVLLLHSVLNKRKLHRTNSFCRTVTRKDRICTAGGEGGSDIPSDCEPVTSACVGVRRRRSGRMLQRNFVAPIKRGLRRMSSPSRTGGSVRLRLHRQV
jgi:hypothetical protein